MANARAHHPRHAQLELNLEDSIDIDLDFVLERQGARFEFADSFLLNQRDRW